MREEGEEPTPTHDAGRKPLPLTMLIRTSPELAPPKYLFLHDIANACARAPAENLGVVVRELPLHGQCRHHGGACVATAHGPGRLGRWLCLGGSRSAPSTNLHRQAPHDTLQRPSLRWLRPNLRRRHRNTRAGPYKRTRPWMHLGGQGALQRSGFAPRRGGGGERAAGKRSGFISFLLPISTPARLPLFWGVSEIQRLRAFGVEEARACHSEIGPGAPRGRDHFPSESEGKETPTRNDSGLARARFHGL